VILGIGELLALIESKALPKVVEISNDAKERRTFEWLYPTM
jgi:hypothetical protein